MSDLIIKRFAERNFGKHQQIAAVANAIAESSLDPNAHATGGEDSVGLFQCNRNGGAGTGFSVAELKDPEVNIRIIADIAAGRSDFVNATSLEAAVDVFVRKVERPANPSQKVRDRTKTARCLL